jgi:hypothetical protein
LLYFTIIFRLLAFVFRYQDFDVDTMAAWPQQDLYAARALLRDFPSQEIVR